MPTAAGSGGAEAWGTIEVEDPDEGQSTPCRAPGQPEAVARRRYIWRPGVKLREHLPPDYSIELVALIRSESQRIAPLSSMATFITHTSLAGHAFLYECRRLGAEASFSYHAMRLVYQWRSARRENLHRYRFRRTQDLLISSSGRTSSGEVDVLPDDLGIPLRATTERWSASKLLQEGRAAANRSNVQTPDEETVIRLGLREAVRLNPIQVSELSPEEMSSIVRLGLFDAGPAETEPSESEKATVQRRFLEALENHISDDTASFETWFLAGNDNIVHSIAKRKDEGGEVPRTVVRQVLLETIFDSFQYIGGCVTAIMTLIAESLPTSLSPEDRAVFDATYVGPPWLGSIPLVLVIEQSGMAREIVLDLLNDPTNPGLQGQLLQMLRWYGDMVGRKRCADRRRQQRSAGKNLAGRTPVELPLKADQADIRESAPPGMQEIAAFLRQAREAHCRCGNTGDWEADFSNSKLENARVRWIDRCRACGHREPVEAAVDEFRRAREQLSESADDYLE
jgi:hypothetical protein